MIYHIRSFLLAIDDKEKEDLSNEVNVSLIPLTRNIPKMYRGRNCLEIVSTTGYVKLIRLRIRGSTTLLTTYLPVVRRNSFHFSFTIIASALYL